MKRKTLGRSSRIEKKKMKGSLARHLTVQQLGQVSFFPLRQHSYSSSSSSSSINPYRFQSLFQSEESQLPSSSPLVVDIDFNADDKHFILSQDFFCIKMGLRLRKSPSDVFFQGRDTPPTHYSFKIQSFSLLSKASIEKYSSDKFDAGDYKWKLSIYPTGSKERDGQGHVSISLTLLETNSLPVGWDVKAIVNFFVFDQVGDKYYTLSDGKVRRFHGMQTEGGIANFIDLEVFSDSSNGYLVNDICVFGVDIFILKPTRKGEFLSMVKEAVTGNHIWKMKSFSTLTIDRYESDAFIVGDHKWKIRIYPRGNGDGKGNSISVFLCLDESTLPPDTRLFVKFILRVMDQNQTKPDHFEFKTENHFGTSCLVWGAQKFMSLVKLSDPKRGFLLGDTCIIEADVTLLGVAATC